MDIIAISRTNFVNNDKCFSVDVDCEILTKDAWQGLTVTLDEARKVIVARIIIDSVIERQGLLRPGDLILEANSTRVKTPEQLQNIIEESPEFLSLKIQPTLSVSQSQPLNTVEKGGLALPNKYYVRCLFSYDPHKDTLLPCTEIGLPFKYGDILQVWI